MNVFESADYAQSLSVCKKKKVGAAIMLANRVVSIGMNHGTTEECNCNMHKSNPDCLHAEVVSFFAEDDFCFRNGVMAVTYIPCLNCAKLIVSKGIKMVYYKEHRDESEKQLGINYLKQHNVEVLNQWKI